jgi:hypothetical protein
MLQTHKTHIYNCKFIKIFKSSSNVAMNTEIQDNTAKYAKHTT